MTNLPVEILKNPKVSAGASLLYLFLKDKQKGAGVARASIKELSEALNISRPTVVRYKKILVNAGVIEEIKQTRDDGGYGTSEFKIIKES